MLAVCLVFTAAVAAGLAWASVRTDHVRFDRAVTEAHQAIRERIGAHISILNATAGLFENQPPDEAGFQRFTARLRLSEDYPGIQGIGWSARLGPASPPPAGRAPWPTREPEAHAIVYLYPLDRRNLAALGFNMFSEPTRWAAMVKARDTGLPTATAPVQLVQEIDAAKQAGFLIYVPVYTGEDAPADLAQRRARLQGFAYGAFRAGDFFESVFRRGADARELKVSVFDSEATRPALIYSSAPAVRRTAEFHRVEILPVAGRTWRIDYESTPAFEAGSRRGVAWLIMALGAVTSIVLYLSTRELMRGRLAAEEAARTAKREIQIRRRAEEHQQLLINELNHRVKNTLATVQSLGAQTLRSAPDMKSARERFESRLVALSTAHDLLTSRRWEGADVVEIVRTATAPFDTGAAPSFRIGGPSVSLPPAQALALGMALHELGTNAVKYGALSAPGGRVHVRWSKDDQILHLSWREEGGPPVAPPTRGGFGVRLIERSLARDLGGAVKLLFRPEGVICEIRFMPGPMQPPQEL